MTALHSHRSFLAGVQHRRAARLEIADDSRSAKLRWNNYVEAEETIRNDYSEKYECGTGEWPSQWILGAGDDELCEEFPALRRLMDLKIKAVNEASAEGTCVSISADVLRPSESNVITTSLTSVLNQRFDVILLSPPLDSASWNWCMTEDLPIRNLSADPGFVFLWVGSANGDGLERGRECLAKWGFRRCEDLIFIKKNRSQGGDVDGTRSDCGLFTSQKEHCLMGIRGTVRRATDSWFVHCNVDVDTFLWDNPLEADKCKLPPYLYTVIENFCLGTRRLELFVDSSETRRGWTSVRSRRDQQPQEAIPALASELRSAESRPLLPFDSEIENLRPKSPTRRVKRDDTMRSRDLIQHHRQHKSADHSTPQPQMPPQWPSHGSYTHVQHFDLRTHFDLQAQMYPQASPASQHTRPWPAPHKYPGHLVNSSSIQYYAHSPMQHNDHMQAYDNSYMRPGFD